MSGPYPGRDPEDAALAPSQDSVDVFDLSRREAGYDVAYAYDRDEVPGIVCDAIPRGARVLDVGCGGGGLARLLRDHNGCDVVGVEPDPRRAALARERGLEVIEAPFGPGFHAPGAPFDAVCFLDVLEHVVDPREALRSAAALLGPDGRIVASVPNVAHWQLRLRLLRGRFDYTPTGLMDYTHLRWFTRASLARLLASADLALVHEAHAVGAWLDAYRRLPARARGPLLRRLVRRLPGLFASQIVVSAAPAGGSGDATALSSPRGG